MPRISSNATRRHLHKLNTPEAQTPQNPVKNQDSYHRDAREEPRMKKNTHITPRILIRPRKRRANLNIPSRKTKLVPRLQHPTPIIQSMIISSRKWRCRTYNDHTRSAHNPQKHSAETQPQKTTTPNAKHQSTKSKKPTIRHPSLCRRRRIHRNH